MKNIHFDNTKNPIWNAVLIISLIFIIIGTFEIFEFQNPKTNKIITVTGFLLQVIFYSRFLYHKHYFQWNKKGTYIRINSWVGKSINFNKIKSTELNDQYLVITKKNGSKVNIDLTNIEKSDAQKLNKIIVSNSVDNPAYY